MEYVLLDIYTRELKPLQASKRKHGRVHPEKTVSAIKKRNHIPDEVRLPNPITISTRILSRITP
jgi:hypothetical protein